MESLLKKILRKTVKLKKATIRNQIVTKSTENIMLIFEKSRLEVL